MTEQKPPDEVISLDGLNIEIAPAPISMTSPEDIFERMMQTSRESLVKKIEESLYGGLQNYIGKPMSANTNLAVKDEIVSLLDQTRQYNQLGQQTLGWGSISAGELRQMGATIPGDVPDYATIDRSDILVGQPVVVTSGAEIQRGEVRMSLPLTFKGPMRW